MRFSTVKWWPFWKWNDREEVVNIVENEIECHNINAGKTSKPSNFYFKINLKMTFLSFPFSTSLFIYIYTNKEQINKWTNKELKENIFLFACIHITINKVKHNPHFRIILKRSLCIIAQKNFPCLIFVVCLNVKVSKGLAYQYISYAKSMIHGANWNELSFCETFHNEIYKWNSFLSSFMPFTIRNQRWEVMMIMMMITPMTTKTTTTPKIHTNAWHLKKSEAAFQSHW